MLVESLRSLLGADLAAQVEAALKGKGKDGRDVDVVVGNDGSYVPAEKYNGAQTASQSAAASLKAAADALKAIGGSGDPAKIAADVEHAKAEAARIQTEYDTKVKNLSRQTAVRLALASEAQDPSDIIPLLDMSKIDVDDAGNLKTDLKPLIDPIKTAKPYLFRAAEPQQAQPQQQEVRGAQPSPNQPSGKQFGNLTPEQVAGLSFSDYKAWRTENQ